jgi:hypothetical protein
LFYNRTVKTHEDVTKDNMPKRTKTISVDSKLVDWVNAEIEKKEFSSLSHAVEKALYELKRSYDQQKK